MTSTTSKKATCACGREIIEFDPVERPGVWTHQFAKPAWLGHVPRPAVSTSSDSGRE